MRRIFLILLTTGCFESELPVAPDSESQTWLEVEEKFRRNYTSVPITLTGTISDANGEPIEGATVVVSDDLGNDPSETKSFENGNFRVPELKRSNRSVFVSAEGFYDRQVPVRLFRSLDDDELDVTITLTRRDRQRLRFGGDVQLGRRYLDTTESTPLDEIPNDDPDALIQASQPLEGTRNVVKGLTHLLSSADFTSVNLETVVTDNPTSPAIGNSFVFFTLPESLTALTELGIDHVSLANNHIYDYDHDGLVDTLQHLSDAGLPNSGAGMTATDAFQGYRTLVGEQPFSLISMVSIEGIPLRNSTGATDERSGAADLNNDERILDAFSQEVADGFLPVAEIHTGYEYMEEPPEDGYTRERLKFVADAGAGLVVAHHPHVPQGFEYHDGVLIAHSLGNLIFEQERLDVGFGAVLTTDFRNGIVDEAFVTPIYLENFVPGLTSEQRAEWILRRMSYSSSLYGAAVFFEQGRGYVSQLENETWVKEERIVEFETTDDFRVVDLRAIRQPGESIVKVESASSVELGRDLMWFGDMEDMDVDGNEEIDRWYYTGTGSFPCMHDVYRGTQAICATRNSRAFSESVIALRNRIRVLGDKLNQPNKNISLIGYTNGQNAGDVRIVSTFTASFGGSSFGEQEIFKRGGGTYDWTGFEAPISMPADDPNIVPEAGKPFDPRLRTDNPRAVRITIYIGPATPREGIARFDDFAVVSWEPISERNLNAFSAPNPFDFVRTDQPATVSVTLAKWRRL